MGNQKILKRLHAITSEQKSKIAIGETRFDKILKDSSELPPPTQNKAAQTDSFNSCNHESFPQHKYDIDSYLSSPQHNDCEQNEKVTEISDFPLNSLPHS